MDGIKARLYGMSVPPGLIPVARAILRSYGSVDTAVSAATDCELGIGRAAVKKITADRPFVAFEPHRYCKLSPPRQSWLTSTVNCGPDLF
jgi:hypothetical protein